MKSINTSLSKINLQEKFRPATIRIFLKKNFRRIALAIFLACLGIILIGLVLGFISLFTACQRVTVEQYNSDSFTFSFPADWQLMSDLWPNYDLKDDYYRLGVTEQVMLTSVQRQGETGAYFAVASAPIPDGSNLEMLFRQTYDQLEGELSDVVESTQEVDGKKGLMIQYRRPWGEPWWEFRDIWLDVDGVAYLLSFHASKLDNYQGAMDQILAGFNFKDSQ